MKLKINENDIFNLSPEEEICVISEETGEILQKFKVQQPIDYYINLIKKNYYINNTEYDKYNPEILCVYVFDSLESKTTKQQEIIDTFLKDVKYALEVAFEEYDETYTHIDLDIPKSLDDDTLWQGIWETMEDNGISYTVKHKDTKFDSNYYYMYVRHY